MFKNKPATIWVITIALCLTSMVPPGTAQNANDKAGQKIECAEIAVKDYPLNNLVGAVIRKCVADNPVYLEDLPVEPVTIEPYKGSVFDFLNGKFFLYSSPLIFSQGAFREATGYEPNATRENKAIVIGLTNDQVAGGNPRPITKGKLRLYQDKNNNYQIHSNAASAKDILDLIYRIFGAADPDAKPFVQGVAKKLFELGIDLEKGDVKVSLAEESKSLNEKLKLAFVKKIFAAQEAASAKEPEVGTEIFPITFVRSRITPAAARSNGSEDALDQLVAAINARFGTAASVKRARQMLVITGKPKDRLEIKRVLTEFDMPWPQVQMTMWTVQVSGNTEKVAPKMLAIKSDIALTQAAMADVLKRLNTLINQKNNDPAWKQRLKKLEALKFNRRADDVLTLNEVLVMLSLMDNPSSVLNDLDKEIAIVIQKLKSDIEGRNKEILEAYKTSFKLKDQELKFHWHDIFPKTLKKTKEVYDSGAISRAHRAIEDFTNSIILFRTKPDDPDAPAALRRDSQAVDRLLQGAIDAYAADMQRLFLDPLLMRIQLLNGGKPKRQYWGEEGVTLTGQSRLVVTSTIPTSLETTVASYANSTRPKPLNVNELLNTAFPRNEVFAPIDSIPKPAPTPTPTGTPTGTPTPAPALPTPQVLTGAARIFSTLGSGEAFLLAAALAHEVEPNFHEVTPGISIKIQPTVFPDGSSVRLAMECDFKVDTKEFGNRGSDVWKQPFADSVKQHKVLTDATVGVFDLFDISSFSLESSYPQTPFYVPVLGRLPVIGPAFQWPRDKKRVHHESIVLVNTIILPRAMDLARFYGGN